MSNNSNPCTDLKKCSRKQKRAHHRVMRDMNIQCCDEPTQYLMICNAGLATGLQTEELQILLNPAVQKYDLIMPPGKSYCFIKFSSKEDTSVAYNLIHGHVRLSSNGGPLYATYTKSVPEVDDAASNSALPSGLRLIENLITQEQEEDLIKSINWNDEGTFSSELKHRKVRHFGYEFKYQSNKIDVEEPIEPIPEAYKFLYTLFKEHGCGNYEYDQLTINCYSPGQGIPPHVDTHSMFEDTILSLSLGSSCVMDFKRNDKKVSIFLPRRSLLIMKDEARYAWTHGICPRHYDPVNKENSSVLTTQPRGTRISFTFRKTRTGDCCCDFVEECDTKQSHYDTSNINNNISTKLESFYVHHVYEEISDHFNETRHKPWPNVMKFLQSLNRGDILLDVGCGNGKYLQPDDHIFKIGCDRSFGLTEISRQRGFEVLLSDCLYLPYKDNAVDAVICIAVIHHLTSHERRKQAVLELARVLKPNGKCLIYVWAKEQNKDSVKSSYLKDSKKSEGEGKQEIRPVLKRTECGLILPVHENRTEFVHNDMLVPWKRKGGGQFLRYYHVFQQNELFQLCSDISFVTVKDLYYDQGNWCIIIEKQNSSKEIE